MSVTVEPGLIDKILANRATIVVQVRHPNNADLAAQALATAVRDIRQQIRDMHGNAPEIVGAVTATVDGPFVWIDGSWQSDEGLATIGDLVARRLRDAGVIDAQVVSPERGGPIGDYMGLDRFPEAVVLYLYADPPARPGGPVPRIPDGWLDAAYQWVAAAQRTSDRIWARTRIVEFPAPLADVADLLTTAARTRADATIVTCNPTTTKPMPQSWPKGSTGRDMTENYLECLGRRIAVATVNAVLHPFVSLAAGGPGCDDDDLLAIYNELVGVGRRLASDAAYAFISFEATLGRMGFEPKTEWATLGGQPSLQLGGFCDECVFDAFPWQVLGPGHLSRLGTEPPGAQPLGDGRVEVTIGEPADWLLHDIDPATIGLEGHRDISRQRRQPGIAQTGRDLLAPCLKLPTTNRTQDSDPDSKRQHTS